MKFLILPNSTCMEITRSNKSIKLSENNRKLWSNPEYRRVTGAKQGKNRYLVTVKSKKVDSIILYVIHDSKLVKVGLSLNEDTFRQRLYRAFRNSHVYYKIYKGPVSKLVELEYNIKLLFTPVTKLELFPIKYLDKIINYIENEIN